MPLITGTVQQISFRPIANGPDQFGNVFRKSLKVNDQWYGFGGAKKEQWNVKVGSDFKILGVGSTVMFKADQNGTFWNGSNLMIDNLVEGKEAGAKAAPAVQGGDKPAYTPKPKDMTGISTGHAFNGAMNFVMTFGVEPTNDNLIRYATSVHNVTEKLKASGKLKYPDMSDYDLGAMIGNAVLNATKLAGTEGDFEANVEGIALDLLDNVVPYISKYIKEGKGAAPAPKVTRAPAAKKPASATKAKPVPAPVPADEDPSDDDLDSDVPF